MALSPLALTQSPVLARFAAGQPIESLAALAREFGRDKGNFAKTIGLLVEEGLLARTAGEPIPALTEAGREALAAIERANNPAASGSPNGATLAPPTNGLTTAPHARIRPDELNPRRAFSDEDIAELADAIVAADFWVSPLLVRPLADHADAGPVHRLVAGERRWRAVGLLIEDGRWPADRPVPVEIRQMDDATHLRIAITENLQRAGLSPLEESRGFDRLFREFGQTTDQIAEGVGKTRRFVQQRLQLLDLSAEDQARLDRREITVEQARRMVQDRPAPIAVTPPQLMLLAEIATRIFGLKTAPAPWRDAEVDWMASKDDLYEELANLGLTRLAVGYHGDQLFRVQLTDLGVRALVENASDFLAEREAALTRLREAAASAKAIADAQVAGHAFVTPWLNPPFETSPEVRKAAEERARNDRIAEEAREQREAEDAAEEAAGFAALLRARLAERQLTSDPVAIEDPTDLLLAEWSALGLTPPFSVAIGDEARRFGAPAVIVDAEGNPLAAAGPRFEALRRLMAMTMNAACGGPVVAGELASDDQIAGLQRAARSAVAASDAQRALR